VSRIGSEISKNRIKMGWTQKQLGKAVGVSESFIRDIETGSKIVGDELFGKIAKALNVNAESINFFTNDSYVEQKAPVKRVLPTSASTAQESAPVNEVWDDALGNILKTVPVFDYSMEEILAKRQLPISGNKVNGHPKDKVFYLTIQDDDMTGLRICQGDVAFCVMTGDVERDGIYFVESNGRRMVRQLKYIQDGNILMLSNKNSLRTEIVNKKELKVIARVLTLEITF
jgi:Predicted transcriptional regulators